MTRKHHIASIITAALLSPIALGMTALPAQAATLPAAKGQQTPAINQVVPAITVNATQPGALTISGHRGLPVTVWTQGTKAQTKRPTNVKPVTFAGLLGGRAYDVYVGSSKAVRVMTTKAATPATNVTVTAGPIEGGLVVTWQIPMPTGVKPETVSYHVVATSKTAAPVELTVRGTDHAILTGLDPKATYSIAITASTGTGTIATATAQLTTTVADVPKATATTEAKPVTVEAVVIKPTVTPQAPTSAPASTPAPAPAPTPAPAPGPVTPKTKTIYICPDGFSDAGDLCQQTLGYTFHDVTTTSGYTYHQEFVKTGSHFEGRPMDWSGTVCYGGTMYAEGCGAWIDDGYYVSVKDAPPTGFGDDGTQYSRTESVKDAIPAGYSDDGSQWIKSAAKIAKEVAA